MLSYGMLVTGCGGLAERCIAGCGFWSVCPHLQVLG
jgi:hypothetical protein